MYDQMLIETSQGRYDRLLRDAETSRLLKSNAAERPGGPQARALVAIADSMITFGQVLKERYQPVRS